MKIDIDKLKKIKDIYIIGHNNIDVDSYFSSYILTKILNSFNIKCYFAILDDYIYSDENKNIINDYLKEKPIILNRKEVNNKNFILVDHNDINQSLKNNNCNILFSIDHHIDTNMVKCYSEEYTSTLLYIYSLFKDKYNFTDEDKILIALSVMTDSEYLTSTRFKKSDKKLYDELNVKIDPKKIRDKYFKTTDFNLDIMYNIINNYKSYSIENINIDRVILKGYSSDKDNIEKYLKEINNIYDNNILIWNEYDTLKTEVYYNGKFVKEYNYILTSSVLIIKDLIKYNVLKRGVSMEKIYNKLVRDNIPEIIKNNGETPITSILDDKRYKEELENKLYEEYKEVIESNGKDRIEELADMIEIIKALAKLENSSLEEVIEVSKEKVKKRGAFDKKIYLEKVIK